MKSTLVATLVAVIRAFRLVACDWKILGDWAGETVSVNFLDKKAKHKSLFSAVQRGLRLEEISGMRDVMVDFCTRRLVCIR